MLNSVSARAKKSHVDKRLSLQVVLIFLLQVTFTHKATVLTTLTNQASVLFF